MTKDTYTPAELEAMTGTQLDVVRGQFEAADIAPPGWRKMVVAEKRRWLTQNLAKFNKRHDAKNPTETGGRQTVSILTGSRRMAAHVAAALMAGLPVSADFSENDEQRKLPKMAKDKNWKRAEKPNMAFPVQMKNGFSTKFSANIRRAVDPKEATRQLRRQRERNIASHLLSSAKKAAMKDKKRGGAAAVQTVKLEESI